MLIRECFLPLRKNVVKHNALVVGWSDFVHDLHKATRVSYIQWCEAKKTKESALYDEMDQSRRQFKTALGRCRQNRVGIECDKLASAMIKKDSKKFWKSVRHKLAADVTANVDEIDNVFIVNVWREKYVGIYNMGIFRVIRKGFLLV